MKRYRHATDTLELIEHNHHREWFVRPRLFKCKVAINPEKEHAHKRRDRWEQTSTFYADDIPNTRCRSIWLR